MKEFLTLTLDRILGIPSFNSSISTSLHINTSNFIQIEQHTKNFLWTNWHTCR